MRPPRRLRRSQMMKSASSSVRKLGSASKARSARVRLVLSTGMGRSWSRFVAARRAGARGLLVSARLAAVGMVAASSPLHPITS